MSRKLLLTGHPACGKTTIIQKVLKDISRPVSGFYTREIREKGSRVGFELVSLDGRTGMLAHLDFKSPLKVGPFGVELVTLEEIMLPALKDGLENGDLLIIDEIGPMEIYSHDFCELIDQIIAGPADILGTIVYRPVPFADGIKELDSVELVKVNSKNRDMLPQKIIAAFEE